MGSAASSQCLAQSGGLKAFLGGTHKRTVVLEGALPDVEGCGGLHRASRGVPVNGTTVNYQSHHPILQMKQLRLREAAACASKQLGQSVNSARLMSSWSSLSLLHQAPSPSVTWRGLATFRSWGLFLSEAWPHMWGWLPIPYVDSEGPVTCLTPQGEGGRLSPSSFHPHCVQTSCLCPKGP